MYDKKKTQAWQAYKAFVEMQPRLLAALKTMSQKEFVERNIKSNELLISQSNVAQVVRRNYFSNKQLEELVYLPTCAPEPGTKLVALDKEGVQVLEKGRAHIFEYASEAELPKTEGIAYLYKVQEPRTATGVEAVEASVHLLTPVGEYKNEGENFECFWY